jgi:hypothetical protein
MLAAMEHVGSPQESGISDTSIPGINSNWHGAG